MELVITHNYSIVYPIADKSVSECERVRGCCVSGPRCVSLWDGLQRLAGEQKSSGEQMMDDRYLRRSLQTPLWSG